MTLQPKIDNGKDGVGLKSNAINSTQMYIFALHVHVSDFISECLYRGDALHRWVQP
jgi:hypothetical protein